MVWIAGVLGRHVGGGRTRALQHHDRFSSVVRRKKKNDGSRKDGGALGRRTTNTNTTGRKSHHSQWGGGGREFDPFFAAVYVDDYLEIRVQHSDGDTTALIASASLGSDYVRLFGLGEGEVGVTPILTPNKSTDWDSTICGLGFTISSHTMRISVPRGNVEAVQIFCSSYGPRADGKLRRGTCLAWPASSGTSRT